MSGPYRVIHIAVIYVSLHERFIGRSGGWLADKVHVIGGSATRATIGCLYLDIRP
ncbi:MAG: hypothetical protein MN733_39660 [Nitrososphaera sp.]|nr:hypothetical protein [Nitrososphaera sp.]